MSDERELAQQTWETAAAFRNRVAAAKESSRLAARIAALEAEVSRLESERDGLIEAWPVWRAGFVIYQHRDDSYWLESMAAERWQKTDNPGPYPTKAAAVEAAVHLTKRTAVGEELVSAPDTPAPTPEGPETP